jgi:DNA-binding transcriptional MerR regulator
MEKELISLGDLSKELGINKSKLNYYAWLKLIEPIAVLGKTMVFEKNAIIKRVNFINEEQKNGKSLKQILADNN